MKVAVVGAGGVGGYFAGRWAEAGLDVTLIARGPHLDAIRKSGLRIESPLGDATVRVSASDDPSEVGPADVIVVATKAWQLPSVAEAVSAMSMPDTVVFGLQNGVEAADVLAETVSPERVLGGTCRIISMRPEPGVVRHVGIDPTIVIGDRKGFASGRAGPVAEALNAASGLTVRSTEDIEAELWRKLLFLAPVSGVGAVTRVTMGTFRSVPETRRLLSEAVEEVARVAAARGIRLPAGCVRDTLAFIDGLPEAGTSSMQRDFQDGLPTELEALSGAVVRLGAEAGVDVPTHTFLYAALRPLDLRAHGEAQAAEI